MPRITQDQYRKLTVAGCHMSNWLFNMAQSSEIPEHLKPLMKQMVKDWDKARKAQPWPQCKH